MDDHQCATATASDEALLSDAAPHRVFISFRFREAKAEAYALRTELLQRGVKVFASGLDTAGDDLTKSIWGPFDEAEVGSTNPATHTTCMCTVVISCSPTQ